MNNKSKTVQRKWITNMHMVDKNGQEIKIVTEHILPQCVVSALLRKSTNKYSYDYFVSIKVWLNKCWNFTLIPSNINTRKASIDKSLKLWIGNRKSQMDENTQAVS